MQIFPKSTTLALIGVGGDPLLVRIPPWEWGDREAGVQRLYRMFYPDLIRHDLFVDLRTGQVCVFSVENVHANYKTDGKARIMAREFLKKAAKRQLSQPGATEVDDAKFESEFPALFQFLACNVDDENSLRERCKVQLFAEGGSWKACIMDPGAEASLFVTLRTLPEVFRVLEKALVTDRPDWRFWKNRKKK